MSKKSSFKRLTGRDNDVKWRLIESRYVCTTRQYKKWMKRYLNKSTRRKHRQQTYDSDAV